MTNGFHILGKQFQPSVSELRKSPAFESYSRNPLIFNTRKRKRTTNLLYRQFIFATISYHPVCTKVSHRINKRMFHNKYYKDDMIYITYLTRNILSLLGIWPSNNKKDSTCAKVWRYFLISICKILLYCVLLPGIFFWLIEKRTQVRIQTIPLLIFVLMGCSKYINLLFHEKKIRRCLEHIEEDYKVITNAEARDTMITSAKIGRRLVSLCAIFMYCSGLSFRLILPFARGKVVTPQNITLRPLPCPSYFLFFDVQVSPTYELIFAIQVLSGLVTYSITTGLCGLATLFVMHACGQLKILINLMTNLVEEKWHEKRELNKKLARMVEHQIRFRR